MPNQHPTNREDQLAQALALKVAIDDDDVSATEVRQMAKRCGWQGVGTAGQFAQEYAKRVLAGEVNL